MKLTETLLHPVYEFRPLPDAFGRYRGETYRFADGEWLPDDGEYDLAFVQGNLCLMVGLPNHGNIIWSWLNGSWRGNEPEHPRGNPWHYMLRDGATNWGNPWGRDRHPNHKAGESGMSWACAKHHSASGIHVEFHLGDPHIAAGMVRERETKRTLTFPAAPRCMYCGDDGSIPLGKLDAGRTALKEQEQGR